MQAADEDGRRSEYRHVANAMTCLAIEMTCTSVLRQTSNEGASAALDALKKKMFRVH